MVSGNDFSSLTFFGMLCDTWLAVITKMDASLDILEGNWLFGPYPTFNKLMDTNLLEV